MQDHIHLEGANTKAGVSSATLTARDPVCGMSVEPEKSAFGTIHEGTSYYFCSANCQAKFVVDPKTYVSKAKVLEEPSTNSETIYTCPMHPQIRQRGPGNCPICGMVLEPLIASGEHVHNLELADMSRRFWFGLAFSVPVVLLGMGGELLGLNRFISGATSQALRWNLN